MHRFILFALLLSCFATAIAQPYDQVAYKRLLDEGIDSFFANNNDFAHQKFTAAYKIDSQSFYSIFYLGWSKLERKEYGEASRLINKAIHIADPGRNEEYGYYVRGLINYEMGRYAASVSDLKKVNAIKPYDPNYTFLLGRSLVASKEFDKALPVVNGLLELDSTKAEGYYFRGLANRYLGRPQAAIADFIKNLSLKAKEIQSLYHLGSLYMQLKDYRRAAAYFDDYLSQRKDAALLDSALLQSGLSHHLAGDQQQSSERLNTLIKKIPSSPLAYAYLGSVAAESKDTAKTREYYNKALSFKPERSVALHLMGKLEFYSGNKIKGQDFLKRASAAAQREKDADELFAISYTYYLFGDTAVALETIARSLSIAPALVAPRLLRITVQMGKIDKEEEVSNDFDKLMARPGIGKKEKAWFLAYKAVAAYRLKRYNDAIGYLDDAILLHEFAEYYALRAQIEAIRYRDMRAANSIIRNEIEQDISKALESGHRKNETVELKAMTLVIFERYKEACELVATIPGSAMNKLCADGEKRSDKWEVRYDLSPYDMLLAAF